MAELINLNKARKAKARSDSQATAAQNRAKFGRSKADKALQTARDEKLKQAVDQARRDSPTTD